jgi:hypothetical protein
MLQLSRVSWSIVLPVLAVIIILVVSALAYQAWRRHKNTDPLANLKPALYQPKSELKDLYLPVPTNTNTIRPSRSN